MILDRLLFLHRDQFRWDIFRRLSYPTSCSGYILQWHNPDTNYDGMTESACLKVQTHILSTFIDFWVNWTFRGQFKLRLKIYTFEFICLKLIITHKPDNYWWNLLFDQIYYLKKLTKFSFIMAVVEVSTLVSFLPCQSLKIYHRLAFSSDYPFDKTFILTTMEVSKLLSSPMPKV